MPNAVIVDAVRTAGGKRYGKLSGWHSADLAAEVLSALITRTDLDPALVEDVIMGCVMQVGNQSVNVGRSAVLAAGWPDSVPATTIDRVGLSFRSSHFPNQLSGGQQQRVAIARAIVGGPSLLLADEPTGNLDSRMGDEIVGILEDLNRKDETTVVMVTHDPRMAARTARTVRLFDGRLVN